MRNVAAALLTVFAAIGCSGTALSEKNFHEPFHQTLPAAGIRVLTLSNVAGKVRIEGSAGSDIRIDAIKNATSQGALSGVRIEVAKNGNAVDVSTHYDESASGISHGSVDYTITIPASLAVSVSNIAGTADIAGLTGDLTAKTQAGTIDASMARAGGNQRIDLSATTGTVALTLPKNADATVSAHSTVGTFNSDSASISRAVEHVVGTRASGKIGSGSAQVTLSTTTGTIDLHSH